MQVLLDSGATVERASIDEAYLDLSRLVEKRLASGSPVSPGQLPHTWIGGDKDSDREETVTNWCQDALDGDGDDLRLAVGAAIIEDVRAEVFRRTEFRCSAGVAHCKTLAKLCCGLNKPNKQTVLPGAKISALYESLAVTKVRGLGGKLGETVVQALEVETMAQLAAVPRSTLESKFEAKTAHWLQLLARGRDGEVVKERELPKSIGCGKNFRGKEKLETVPRVEEKLTNLVEELMERLEEDRDEHGRMATGLTVGVAQEGIGWVSRVGKLPLYTAGSVFAVVMGILTRLNTAKEKEEWCPALLNISISAGKFVTGEGSSNQSITSFFSPGTSNNIYMQMAKQKPRSKTPSKPSIKSFFGAKMLSMQKEVQTSPTPSVREEEEDETDHENIVNCDKKEIHGNTSEAQVELPKEPDDNIEIFQHEKNNSEHDHDSEGTLADITTFNHSSPEDSVNAVNERDEDESRAENCSDFDIAELIPSLDSYEPSLLEILPQHLKEKAIEWVNNLKDKETKPTVTKNLSTTFLSTVSQPQCQNEENEGNNLVECETCQQKVSAFTLPEHLDWHFAVNLSKQPNPNAILQNTKSQSQLAGKRKREPASKLNNSDSTKKPCKENISNYFKKS